jgi:hypothetical protein
MEDPNYLFYQLIRTSKTIFQDRTVLLHLLFSIISKRKCKKKMLWTDYVKDKLSYFLQYNHKLNNLEFVDKIKELAKI